MRPPWIYSLHDIQTSAIQCRQSRRSNQVRRDSGRGETGNKMRIEENGLSHRGCGFHRSIKDGRWNMVVHTWNGMVSWPEFLQISWKCTCLLLLSAATALFLKDLNAPQISALSNFFAFLWALSRFFISLKTGLVIQSEVFFPRTYWELAFMKTSLNYFSDPGPSNKPFVSTSLMFSKSALE